MPASLLSRDSAALERSRKLLAEFPSFADRPGLPQARMLVDYILGRRAGELDVSGRDAQGTFVPAEAVARQPQRIIVVDDAHGMQTTLMGRLAEVETRHDRIDEERSVEDTVEVAETAAETGNPPVEDGQDPHETWAVVNAPKATNALAETIATLHPSVTTIIVIGRSDAMSRAVNKELARGFGRVDVSPGVGKHRMIIGSRPLPTPSLSRFPKHGTITHPGNGDLEVRAHGACFSGIRKDEGSALLLDSVQSLLTASGTGEEAAPDSEFAPGSVLDLGCGNGWLLTAVMQATGAARGAGLDVSRAAVASARATAEANGIDVDIRLADAADSTDPELKGLGEFDLVLLNPPFHQGTAIETDSAEAMMAAAARHLAPGGVVITVFNSHLRYRGRLEAIIGDSEQLARNKKFTVIASRG
ncbi:class I SAM-dependent methyltransferase [Brevibacterium renqingii]|uniref:class I SAM-dependent methyltransferase n=1 Tax=Brevibacterium renqingii TaxID=2776916 RepID=UPI001AE0AA0A|nr:methyltransferase [Brevibacterium renqingii]